MALEMAYYLTCHPYFVPSLSMSDAGKHCQPIAGLRNRKPHALYAELSTTKFWVGPGVRLNLASRKTIWKRWVLHGSRMGMFSTAMRQPRQ